MELYRCPHCGHFNPPDRGKCFLCKQDLPSTDKMRRSPPKPEKVAPEGKAAPAGKGALTGRAAGSRTPGARRVPWGWILGIGAVVVVVAVLIALFAGGEGGGIFRRDEEPPALVSVEPTSDKVLAAGPVTFQGQASEPLASATVDGAPAQVQEASFTLDLDLTEGRHTLEIVLTDAAGNQGTATATLTAVALPSGFRFARIDPAGRAVLYSPLGDVELVKIPGGGFRMGNEAGDADEKPVREVTLSPFAMALTETTNAQYSAFAHATGARSPRDPGWGGELADYYRSANDGPVVNVSWDDARAYCEWAGLRLPTEAEWEYAARGPDSLPYPWGTEEPDVGGVYRANLEGAEDGFAKAAPVGTFPSGGSPFAVQDLVGNLWEWVSDWYDATAYRSGPVTDPDGPPNGTKKVLRGGSWSSRAPDSRPTNRYPNAAGTAKDNVGFRCAASL
jgi:sulfatase modifying factor 1